MQTQAIPTNPYALRHTQQELERLVHQGRFLGETTEYVLRQAGLEPGMRVLDVGCGAGDVAFLAAKLVGPEGAVIGVDRAPEAVGFAQQRAQQAGLENVRFVAADITQWAPEEPVDALIGRLVLMYFPDPASVLQRMLSWVRPGGVVAFQELDTPVTPPPAVMCDPNLRNLHGRRHPHQSNAHPPRRRYALRRETQAHLCPGRAAGRADDGHAPLRKRARLGHLRLDRAVDPRLVAADAADRRRHRRRSPGGYPGRAHAPGSRREGLHPGLAAAGGRLGA